MAIAQPSNLLDEAVDGKGAALFLPSPRGGGGRMILVEDCVETSGAFVVHHLLKRSLSPQSSDVVVFLSLAHPFSHYDRILRKMVTFIRSTLSNWVKFILSFSVTIGELTRSPFCANLKFNVEI